jgi:hypothetical protein
VSWGSTKPPSSLNIPNNAQEVKNSNYDTAADTTRAGPSGQTVSLQSIMQASPLESEAEAYIQRSLDHCDPAEASLRVLGFVPDAATPDVFVDDVSNNAPLKLPRHRKTKSTAQELCQFTSDLVELNDLHKDLHRDDDGVNIPAALSPKAATKRHRDEESSVMTREKRETARDGWKKVQGAVVGLDAFLLDADAQRKKTDDVSDESRDDNDLSDPTTLLQTNRKRRSKNRVASTYTDFKEWLKVNRDFMFQYCKIAILYVMIPATGIAAILFYLLHNPPCGTTTECLLGPAHDSLSSLLLQMKTAVYTGANGTLNAALNATNTTAPGTSIKNDVTVLFQSASYSWWILFILVRQVCTLSLSLATQALVIDYLALRSKLIVRLFGPFVTLYIIQSKGWPLVMVSARESMFLLDDYRILITL